MYLEIADFCNILDYGIKRGVNLKYTFEIFDFQYPLIEGEFIYPTKHKIFSKCSR